MKKAIILTFLSTLFLTSFAFASDCAKVDDSDRASQSKVVETSSQDTEGKKSKSTP